MKIGYARVSTAKQDLTARLEHSEHVGVDPAGIYPELGITGSGRDRPGLKRALGAAREGDVLVFTRLDCLAHSNGDAHDIADELTEKGVVLDIGTKDCDPKDPVGTLLFDMPAMVARFEADIIPAQTREGMAVAEAQGFLRGRKPKLYPKQEMHLVKFWQSGEHTSAELASELGVARSGAYRAVVSTRTKAGASA